MDLLFKLGVPTYVFTIEIEMNGQQQIQMGERMPVDLGWIYGISTNINGVTATTGFTLPNDAQVNNLYVSFKYGQAIYVDQYRLSEMVFTTPQTAGGFTPQWQNPHRYLPFNIPLNTDLQKSFIQNPLLYNAPMAVALNLFYIDKTAYANLVNEGMLLMNGINNKGKGITF